MSNEPLWTVELSSTLPVVNANFGVDAMIQLLSVKLSPMIPKGASLTSLTAGCTNYGEEVYVNFSCKFTTPS